MTPTPYNPFSLKFPNLPPNSMQYNYLLNQLISQYPEAFQKVILEEGGGSIGQQSGQGQNPPPGAIQISPEEAAAIERVIQFIIQLMSLGFNKLDAAQAYFACEKNQELAANILFDRQANGDLDPLEDGPGGQGGNQGNEDDDDDNLFN